MNLSGGDMLMRALREEGVKFIFGYPGGAALHIYDSVFRQKSIEHILVRHEQGATLMQLMAMQELLVSLGLYWSLLDLERQMLLLG